MSDPLGPLRRRHTPRTKAAGRRTAAVHEAGHAIVARHLGFSVTAVIRPTDAKDQFDRSWSGQTRSNGPTPNITERQRRMIAIAGHIAEQLWNEARGRTVDIEGDFKKPPYPLSDSDRQSAGFDWPQPWPEDYWRDIRDTIALMRPLWPEIAAEARSLIVASRDGPTNDSEARQATENPVSKKPAKAQKPTARMHFVPDSFQANWAREDGQVLAWNWEEGDLRWFWTIPRHLMVKKNLYRAEHVEDPAMYDKAFGQIEGQAVRTVKKFRRLNLDALTNEDRYAWTSFLLLQRGRGPDKVAGMKLRAQQAVEEHLGLTDAEWQKAAGPEFPSVKRYLEVHQPHVLANFALERFLNLVLSDDMMNRVLKMRWLVIYDSPFPLLLGDEPVMMNGDLMADSCLIEIPISPKESFIAATDQEFIDAILELDAREYALSVNFRQLVQASRTVIGHAPPEFIARFLRKPAAERADA